MPAPLLFVPGTHEADPVAGACDPCEGFYGRARALGLPIVAPDGPYWWAWSTALDGLLGANDGWEGGAAALVDYVRRQGVDAVSLVCHSHGGNVALRAARDLRIDLLVTVATPVRRDTKQWVREARGNVCHWVHVYAPMERGIPWQRLGALGDGALGLGVAFRWADRNLPVLCQTHGGLLDHPVLWGVLTDYYGRGVVVASGSDVMP